MKGDTVDECQPEAVEILTRVVNTLCMRLRSNVSSRIDRVIGGVQQQLWTGTRKWGAAQANNPLCSRLWMYAASQQITYVEVTT
jgi:hypothetical protein